MLTSVLFAPTVIGLTEHGVRVNYCVEVGLRREALVDTAEQILTVEVRILRDAVDFKKQLRYFGLQAELVAVRCNVRRGFDSKVADALQNVGFRLQGAVRDGRCVVHVLDVVTRLIKRCRLRVEASGDRESRGVVCGRVDPETARQPGHGSLQHALIPV